jgi:hypothetical protein
MGIALDGCHAAVGRLELERVAAAAFDGMMSGTPALTPMPLRIAASTRERQPPLAGWNANTVDAARMARCSNTARWICCSGCAARGLRYDPVIGVLHYFRSADRRRFPLVGRTLRGGGSVRMESTRKP